MDISINEKGEFILNGNDIGLVDKDNLRYQEALCIVKSITNDWHSNKKLGADLEEIVGQPAINLVADTGVQKITTALLESSLYSKDEIYIEYSLNKNIIEYKVYLRNLDKITSKVLNVILDLVMGVNVRIGVD